MTLDELIRTAQDLREQYGGDVLVAHYSDDGFPITISQIRRGRLFADKNPVVWDGESRGGYLDLPVLIIFD